MKKIALNLDTVIDEMSLERDLLKWEQSDFLKINIKM